MRRTARGVSCPGEGGGGGGVYLRSCQGGARGGGACPVQGEEGWGGEDVVTKWPYPPSGEAGYHNQEILPYPS